VRREPGSFSGQPSFHGPASDAQNPCSFFRIEILDIPKEEHFPVLYRQRQNRAAQHVTELTRTLQAIWRQSIESG